MKPNVLITTSTFPRFHPDPLMPQFIFELARELTRYCNVYVLAPHAQGSMRYEEVEGMRIIRYRYFLPTSSQTLAYGTGMLSGLKSNPLNAFQIPSFLYCQYQALVTAVQEFDIQVVNSHWMIPQGLIAALAKKRLDFKHVMTIHAAGLFALRRLPFGKQMARYIVKHSDSIYSVSHYNQRMLEQLIRRTVPCNVFPMGIDTAYYAERADTEAIREKWGVGSDPMILYVGKLSEKKGVHFLLQAMPGIVQQIPKARLVIVGRGILEASLKEEVERLGMAPSITFAGYQDKETVKSCFQSADVVVVPSIIDSKGETEGLPVVLLEALACGKPVVATNVGGAPDILVSGENGYLVEPESAQELTDHILKVLQGDSATFTDNAVQTVRRFDWKSIGQHYHDTFQTLLKD